VELGHAGPLGARSANYTLFTSPAHAQVRAGDGRVRADAAVNSGNALAAAAEAERAAGGGAGRPHSLLAAAAYAYRAALAQEEDALVGPERRSASLTFCLPAVSRQREAPSPDVLLSLSLCAAPLSWSVTEQPQLLTASGAVGTCWWAGPGLQR